MQLPAVFQAKKKKGNRTTEKLEPCHPFTMTVATHASRMRTVAPLLKIETHCLRKFLKALSRDTTWTRDATQQAE